MCGIFCILNNGFSKEVVLKNFEKGKSRGPESSKIMEIDSPNAFLGFHRLDIFNVQW